MAFLASEKFPESAQSKSDLDQDQSILAPKSHPIPYVHCKSTKPLSHLLVVCVRLVGDWFSFILAAFWRYFRMQMPPHGRNELDVCLIFTGPAFLPCWSEGWTRIRIQSVWRCGDIRDDAPIPIFNCFISGSAPIFGICVRLVSTVVKERGWDVVFTVQIRWTLPGKNF